MFRIRTVFTGVAGTPWYSNIYFQGGTEAQATSAQDAVGDFWTRVSNHTLSSQISWEVEGSIPVISPATGDITDVVGAAPINGVGLISAALAPVSSQALITLRTGVVRRNRLVQGRIFVPGLSASVVDADGDLSPAAVTNLQLDANLLRESEAGGFLNGLTVWARPRTVFGIDLPGAACGVTTVAATSKLAVLRSRRD